MKRYFGTEGEVPNAQIFVGEQFSGPLFVYVRRKPFRVCFGLRSWLRPHFKFEWLGFA